MFAASFSFAFGNFAHCCVVFLNALQRDRDKKKKNDVFAMGCFSLEIVIHCQRRQEVPLSHWFAVSGGKMINLLAPPYRVFRFHRFQSNFAETFQE